MRAGERTSHFGSHLLSLLDRFFKLSRDERPGGSLHAFALGMTLSCLLQTGFRFFHHSSARHPNGSPYGFPAHIGKTTGLPCFL
jgi:hypothetical protein